MLTRSSIQCPYCVKELCINESKAYLVTLPAYTVIAIALSVFTDLSWGAAIVAISLIVVLSYYPARSIEILSTRLKLSE